MFGRERKVLDIFPFHPGIGEDFVGKKTTVECNKYPKQKDPNDLGESKNQTTRLSGPDVKIEVLNVEHLKYVLAFFLVGVSVSCGTFLCELFVGWMGQKFD